MDVRKGFDRLSRMILGLIWVVFVIVGFIDGNPAQFGSNLVYMLVFTVCYMVFCKGVAWVYNGFFSK